MECLVDAKECLVLIGFSLASVVRSVLLETYREQINLMVSIRSSLVNTSSTLLCVHVQLTILYGPFSYDVGSEIVLSNQFEYFLSSY